MEYAFKVDVALVECDINTLSIPASWRINQHHYGKVVVVTKICGGRGV